MKKMHLNQPAKFATTAKSHRKTLLNALLSCHRKTIGLLVFMLFAFNVLNAQTYYLNDDFEDNNITGWTESTAAHWGASATGKINGSYSLKHVFATATAATDQISYALTSLDLSAATTTWNFKVKHGILPSSNNAWSVFLFSNDAASQMYPSGTADGYCVGVNYSGSTDDITLWKITNGAATAIITSTIDWELEASLGTTGVGQIQVIRTTTGGWTLKIDKDNNGTYDYTSSETTDNTYSTASYFGAYFKYSSTGDQLFWIDDISISQPSAACTAPTTQASGMSTNTPTTDGFSTAWTAGNGNGTMVVVRPTAQANTTPTSGTSYTANLAWASAGQIDANNRVIFRTAGTTAGPVTGLTAETQYTITAYEYNTTGNCYNLTSPPSTTRYTLSLEPSAHAASFTATAASSSQIDLSFSAASTLTNADGYIILQRSGANPTGTPTDATAYIVGNTIGDGTVAAIITSSASTSTSITGLSASTQYNFSLIPYNWDGTNAQTYNYRVAATIPTCNATTSAPATPTIALNNTGFAQISTDATPAPSTTKVILCKFRADVTVANATLNSVAFTTAGTYVGGGTTDIAKFELYYSSTTTMPGSSLASTTTIPLTGNTVTFASLTQVINSGTSGYFWITADIAATATVTRTISALGTGLTLTFASGTPTGTIPNPTVQTITASSAPCISVGFEGSTSDPAGWSNNSGYYVNGVADAHGGTYYAGENAVGDWIKSEALTNPSSVSFWCKASSATANYTVLLESTTDGTAWNTEGTYAANGSNTGSVTDAYSQKTVALSSSVIAVRWRMTARSGGSFYFDDVNFYCGAACTPPTTQATVFGSNTITNNSMNITWNRGNGTAGVIVVARASGAVNADPSSGTSYTANAAFSSGNQIGTGNFVVYNGTGTNVTVTGLTPGITYYYAIYEYNTTGTCYHLTELTGNATTLCSDPTTQASLGAFGTVTSSSIVVNWTRGGTPGDGVIVVAKAGSAPDDPSDVTSYTANAAFGSGTQIGTGTYVVYMGALNTVTVTGLSSSTTYYFKVYEKNCTGTSIMINTSSPGNGSQTTIAGPCLEDGFNNYDSGTRPSGWTFTSIPNSGTYTSAGNYGVASPSLQMDATNDRVETSTLSSAASQLSFWIKGLSTNATSALLVEGWDGSSWQTIQNITNSIPTTGTTYTYNSGTTPALPMGLTKFRFTYTKSAGNVAFDDVVVNCGACAEPTTNATSISITSVTNNSANISWTSGNGSSRIVVAREGAAVNFTPSDNITYAATSVFSDATDLGSGNKVVYNGGGNSFTLTGLIGGTTYYFKIYEYSCNPGSEDYYTGGTPLTGNTTTLISPVTDLKVSCQTNTTADISWTLPVGNFTGVIIGIRNSTTDAHTVSGDADGYVANSVFPGTVPAPPATSAYGGTSPYSWVAYKGGGTSVTISGLTAGQDYKIKAYTYLNNTGTTWSTTTPTTSITSLSTANVTNPNALGQNSQVQLQWTNPGASCFNEVMIVANAGAAITTVPTGDGSAYTANLAFGSGTAYGTGFVVYKGGLSPQTITNLSNGTSYCFSFFTRNGTSWSSGVSACATPANVTKLYPGDLAIVAVNTQCKASGSADEICFFAFKDITEGTAIDFTDNGYERLYADLWADSEGTIRLLRNAGAGTVPKGQVICFQGAGSSSSNFDIFVCGVLDNSNWTISPLNQTGTSPVTYGSYDLNVDDQIWIMQGGQWDNPAGLHNSTYTGEVLYGWTATGWKAAPGYDDTKGSTLYPSTECFTTNVQVTSNHSKVKYIGTSTITSQFDWLLRINDNSNWDGYADNTAYNAGGRNYVGDCYTFESNADISNTAGIWTGASGTDWFYCGNWENLQLPGGTSNVTIKAGATNNIVVDDGITSMPAALCNDITLSNSITLTLNNVSSAMNIYGNMDNGTTVNISNGEMHFKGNCNNTGTFTHSGGTVFFDGSSPQTITGLSSLYNLTIGNTSSGVTLANNLTVNNNLTLTQGALNTSSFTMQFGTGTGARGGTISRTSGYVNGNFKRWFTNATNSGNTGLFPMGATLTVNGNPNAYMASQIEFTGAPTAGGSLTAKFITSLPGDIYSGFDLTDGAQIIDHTADEGIWQIDAGDGLTGGTYTCTLTATSLATVNDASQIRIIKRPSAGGNWTLNGTHGTSSGAGTVGSPLVVTRTGMSGFSQFALGAKFSQNPLPVELVYFKGKNNGNQVDLTWLTASETNNDYFTIERSKDGKFYEFLQNVQGAGNAKQNNSYLSIDKNPYKGINFYRLYQTDFDGKQSASSICTVFVNGVANNSLEVISVQQKENFVETVINSGTSGLAKLSIIDFNGRQIYSREIETHGESEKFNFSGIKLTQGLYILKLSNQNEVAYKKFIVNF